MPDQSRQRDRRTATKEQRAAQLIEAAMEAIATNGLSRTTTAVLTERAGLSVGIINLHFGSKENLLTETLKSLVHEHRGRWIAAADDASLDPAAQLWALMEAHFHPDICTGVKIAVWFAFFGESGHRDTYRAISESYDTERGDFLQGCCARLIADDGGLARLDPARLAQLIESTADGLWLDMLLYPGAIDRDRARAQMWLLLHGFFPRHFPTTDPTPRGPA